MKTLSKILSADPRPVALIVFVISALCGILIISGYPSADFLADRALSGTALVISGVLGILFLLLRKKEILKIPTFVLMVLFYYLTSASAINGLLYDSAMHLVLGMSLSWVFIHQNKLCVND